MKAVILAGVEGDKAGILQEKASLVLKGVPMVSYIIRALKNSLYVNKILVVGNHESLQPIIGQEVEDILPDQLSMMDNLKKGLEFLQGEEEVLIVTCDIPLIHAGMVDDFIEKTFQIQGDVYYPIVEKEICTSNYPGVRRTYVALRDGIFTGGNMALVNPRSMKSIEMTLGQLIKYRKNPIKMSKAIGPGILIKLLFKQLSVNEVENYIERKFGIRARAIISPYPEIANDIDKIGDIKLLEGYL